MQKSASFIFFKHLTTADMDFVYDKLGCYLSRMQSHFHPHCD
jgi:hypothetical protein